MSEPRTIRELNISFSVFQKMVWTIIGFLGALIIGAIAIYIQTGDLKTDLAVVKANTSNIVERLKGFDSRIAVLDSRLVAVDKNVQAVDKNVQTIDRNVQAIDRNVQEARSDDRVLRAIGRVENQGIRTDPVVAGFYVTTFEATLIMQYLRLPTKTGNAPILSIGSRVDDTQLRPMPEAVVMKSPRLKGMRYIIDQDNFSIALVGPDTDIVFAIL